MNNRKRRYIKSIKQALNITHSLESVTNICGDRRGQSAQPKCSGSGKASLSTDCRRDRGSTRTR